MLQATRHLRGSARHLAAMRVPLLAALLVSLVGGWQIVRSREAALADARRDSRNLTRSLAQHADRTVEIIDLVLQGVAERVAAVPDDTGLKRHLERRAGTLTQTHALAVTDAEGRWTHDSLPAHAPISSAGRAYLAWHRLHPAGGLHVDAPVASAFSDRAVLPLSRRLPDQDGAFRGVVVAELAPEALQTFYEGLMPGRRGMIALWNDEGRLLVRHPASPESHGRNLSHLPLFEALGRAAAGTFDLPAAFIDGVERIVAYQRLEGHPHLIVSVGVAVEDVIGPWRREAVTQGAVLALAALALVGLGLGLARHEGRARAAEAEARASGRLLSTALDNMDQGLLMIDAAGIVRVHNRRAPDLLGVPESFVAGRPSYRALRDHLRREGLWGEVVQDAKRWHLNAAIATDHVCTERRRPDGSVLEVRLTPMADGGVVQTLTDVTARRRAEGRLAEERDRFQGLLDSISDWVWEVDAEGRYTYASGHCLALLGRAPDEIIGKTPFDLMPPDEAQRVRTQFMAIAGARRSFTGLINRNLRADGTEVVLETSGVPILSGTGELLGYRGVDRDVTERQGHAAQIEQARAAAEAGARAKTEFLANMSHELRTPLTGILGLHDILQADASLSPRQRQWVGLAQRSGRQLLAIVNDILDFSKIEAGQLRVEAVPFQVRTLVEGCRQLGAEAGPSGGSGGGLEVTAEIAADVPDWLVGDPTRVRQVLLNLVMNAVKFTHQGSVALRVGWVGGGRLRLAVEDTGIGIGPDTLPLLFERFAQGDGSMARRFGGTGLGLAICKRLVQLMDGEIGARSRVGEGSAFWFDLPLKAAGAGPGEEAEPAAVMAPARRPRRLLVAEDNPINQEIIRSVLARKGHDVALVGDGAAALAAFRAGPAFDLVLMDVQMPGMDGLAATGAIRTLEREEGRARTPVAALTANALPEEVERCRAAGMDAHVPKPIVWADLFDAMDRLCADASCPAEETRPAEGSSALLDEAALGAPVEAVGRESSSALIDEAALDAPVEAVGRESSSALLDEAALGALVEVVGREGAAEFLASFAGEAERRLALVEAPGGGAAELGRQAHALVSMAGQLGLREVSGLCRELEEAAGRGAGLDRLPELRAAIRRALDAAAASSYARAA